MKGFDLADIVRCIEGVATWLIPKLDTEWKIEINTRLTLKYQLIDILNTQ